MLASTQIGTSRAHNRFFRPTMLMVFLGTCLALLCETFLFNMPYWQTRSATTSTVSHLSLGTGIERYHDGALRIANEQQRYLEVTAAGQNDLIRYIRLNTSHAGPSTWEATYSVVTRQPHTLGWFSGGSVHRMNSSDSRSQLIRLDNRAEGVRVEFHDSPGTVLPITGATLNPRIAFNVSPLRLCLELLVALGIVFLRPGSFLFHIPLRVRSGQSVVLAMVVCLGMVMVWGVWLLVNGGTVFQGTFFRHGSHWLDYEQYARLADALIHGKTNLDLPVPDSLTQLSNPYDPDIRNIISNGGQTPLFWDHAYYQGKYYAYFGVIPALLLYAPYQIITGHWLSTGVAVLVLSLLAALTMSLLIITISTVLFPQSASLGMTILMVYAGILGSSILYQCATPNFYSVPGAASLMFTCLGLTCWLLSRRRDQSLNRWLLFVGSLSLAANLGCRPQFAIAALLAFPLFWKEIRYTRQFFSIKGWANTTAAILPFILVILPLGWYNQIRFGSFLNLGSNYNLTGFDMTRMHLPSGNIIPIVWYAFFQPVSLTMQFPYANATSTPLPFWSPAETSFGGIFAISPVLILAAFTPWLLSRTNFRIKALALTSVTCGLLVAVVDSSMTGLSWRYYLDWSWLFVIATALCCLTHDEGAKSKDLLPRHSSDNSVKAWSESSSALSRTLRMFILCAIVFSAAFQFLALFSDQRFISIRQENPAYYFTVAHWFSGI